MVGWRKPQKLAGAEKIHGDWLGWEQFILPCHSHANVRLAEKLVHKSPSLAK